MTKAPERVSPNSGYEDRVSTRNDGSRGGLVVSHLSVRFGATRAIDDVCLTIPTGEILAVLGASGSGKSTLLRTIAGLERQSSGTVAWDGEVQDDVPTHRRGFTLMFQDGQLFPHRDVRKNIAYGLLGLPASEKDRRVDELLDMVELAGYSQREVTSLSGGEQQRVALARALAPHPRMVLLDEPFSSLDRTLRERLVQDVRDVLEKTRSTAVFVTHDIDEAMTISDRIAIMEKGRIIDYGPPQRIWNAPANEATARFLGYTPISAQALGLEEKGMVGLRARSFAIDDGGPLESIVVGLRHRREGVVVRVEIPDVGQVDVIDSQDMASGERVRLRVVREELATIGDSSD